MRIVVASSTVPFIDGGGQKIVVDLVRGLTAHGHEVEKVEIPFWSDPETMLDQMLAFRLLDLSDAGERLIAIRTPSQLLRHPNKVLWFIHHERQVYDLWGSRYHSYPATDDAANVRAAIIAADNDAFRSATKIFTNSKVVRERLLKYNGVESTVLYPPLGDSGPYRCDSYGDFIFYPSRLASIKRQDLLIAAMEYVETDVKLVLAGRPDVGTGEASRLRGLIRRHRANDRVELLAEWIPEEEKQRLFATALAGASVPFDEDSYGYTALECCHSHKAVITCSDSGGTLELVEDGVTGRVVPPDPRALAAAMDELFDDREAARRMGDAAEKRIAELGITWQNVVDALTR